VYDLNCDMGLLELILATSCDSRDATDERESVLTSCKSNVIF
jgi:hypothetical protein